LVVIARLLYAASAWHGFTKAADRRRINLLLERAKRFGYCMPDLPTFEELCDTADDQLLNKTVANFRRVLHTILPPPSIPSQHYNLRRRSQTLSLPGHVTYLSDCNFTTRMLYKHCYQVVISSFHVLLTFTSTIVINVVQQLLFYPSYIATFLFRQCLAPHTFLTF